MTVYSQAFGYKLKSQSCTIQAHGRTSNQKIEGCSQNCQRDGNGPCLNKRVTTKIFLEMIY